jgi:predicted GIY-YIG superfamily endonuclease
MDKDYYVYILVSQRNDVLYVGFTSNLIKREHAEILSINPLYPPVSGDF